jgi:hypothetical protein
VELPESLTKFLDRASIRGDRRRLITNFLVKARHLYKKDTFTFIALVHGYYDIVLHERYDREASTRSRLDD